MNFWGDDSTGSMIGWGGQAGRSAVRFPIRAALPIPLVRAKVIAEQPTCGLLLLLKTFADASDENFYFSLLSGYFYWR